MSKLRVGLIGTGVISRDKHLPALTKMENIEITVLCDVDVAKAEKVKEDYALAEAKITADSGGCDPCINAEPSSL